MAERGMKILAVLHYQLTFDTHREKNDKKKNLQLPITHYKQKPSGCRSLIISKNQPVPTDGQSTGASLVLFGIILIK